jgi:hypothetical protein
VVAVLRRSGLNDRGGFLPSIHYWLIDATQLNMFTNATAMSAFDTKALKFRSVGGCMNVNFTVRLASGFFTQKFPANWNAEFPT